MPRARISVNGPIIAKQGFDVNTASQENLAFSPQWVAARVYTTGLLAVAAYSGFMDDRYWRGSVTYDKTFATPPIVMVAGVETDRRDITPLWGLAIPTNPGTARILPWYEIVATTTGFTLSVLRTLPAGTTDAPTTWRYVVLENTLDPA